MHAGKDLIVHEALSSVNQDFFFSAVCFWNSWWIEVDDKLIYLKVNRPLQVSSRNMSSHGAYTVLLGAVQSGAPEMVTMAACPFFPKNTDTTNSAALQTEVN